MPNYSNMWFNVSAPLFFSALFVSQDLQSPHRDRLKLGLKLTSEYIPPHQSSDQSVKDKLVWRSMHGSTFECLWITLPMVAAQHKTLVHINSSEITNLFANSINYRSWNSKPTHQLYEPKMVYPSVSRNNANLAFKAIDWPKVLTKHFLFWNLILVKWLSSVCRWGYSCYFDPHRRRSIVRAIVVLSFLTKDGQVRSLACFFD